MFEKVNLLHSTRLANKQIKHVFKRMEKGWFHKNSRIFLIFYIHTAVILLNVRVHMKQMKKGNDKKNERKHCIGVSSLYKELSKSFKRTGPPEVFIGPGTNCNQSGLHFFTHCLFIFA